MRALLLLAALPLLPVAEAVPDSTADRLERIQVTETVPPPPPPVPHYDQWIRLQRCESSYLGWTANTGNGYYGGLQFALRSWRAVGGDEFASRPDLATPLQQMIAAERLLSEQGWRAWPTCSRRLGLR